MNDMEIRKAEIGDEKILAYIQTESWKQAFNAILTKEQMERYADIARCEAMYKNIIEKSEYNIYIQLVSGVPHCICVWGKNRKEPDNGNAELICIHSLPDKRRHGYGTKMMRYILNEIKNAGYSDVVLWCFEENAVARKFYEKLGFVCTGRTKDSFGPVEVEYKLER